MTPVTLFPANKTHWRLLLLLLLALMAACSSAPKKGSLGTLGNLPIVIDKDAPIDSARDKAMASYWEFMNNAPQDSLKIEALRRLADLELQKSEETVQQDLERITANQEAMSQQDTQKLKGISYEKAIKLYEDAIAAAEQTGTQVDADVMYQLSKAYEDSGNLQKSLQSLDRLLAHYPGIENRDEIHFRRGELLFKLEQYPEADLAYTQAMVVSPTSPYYSRALSKRGWTAYKQHNFEKGLYSFFSVIDRYFRNDDGSLKRDLKRGEREFLDDTLRAIVLSFNEMGGAETLSKYLEQNGSLPYDDEIYLALGNFYLSKQLYVEARKTFDEFARNHGESPKAPLFELKGIDAMASAGIGAALLNAKVAFAGKYQVGGQFWNSQAANVRKSLLPLLSQNVEDIATYYHSLAQKTKQSQDAVLAQHWYKQYLKQFPDSDGAKHMNFLLAESLFEYKSYDEAAVEYQKTAYQYPAKGVDAEAAYASLLAFGKHAEQLNGKDKQDWIMQAAQAAQRFANTFPDDTRAPQVVTKVSQDLFAMKEYPQAAASAEVLLKLKNISADMQRIAWTIIASNAFENKQYDQAESGFKKARDLAQPSQQAELKTNIAAAIYKQGEALRESGKNDLAAAQFRRLGEEVPDSSFNKAARFDLATALLQQKHYQGAIDALLAFRQDYPNDELSRKVSNNLAVAYNGIGNPVAAAEEMEYLMRSEQDQDKKRDMAWQIAQIYDEAGMQQEMLDSYLFYVNNFSKPVEPMVEAANKVAAIYQNRGDHERYVFWLDQVIRSDDSAAEQRTDRTRFLAANATFILAEPKFQQYNAIQLKAPLKTNLSLKKKRMKEAVDAYTRAANYGIADVTTAAYYHLGEIYGNFSKELMDSERPAGLTGAALQEYDTLLEEQAFPYEEKSIALFEENIKLIRDGFYDQWVKKSFGELRRLIPLRYSKEERRDVVADLVQ